MEHIHAHGAMLITAPTDAERRYQMAVRVTRAELIPMPGYTLHPWISITANVDTGDVTLGAGVTAKKA